MDEIKEGDTASALPTAAKSSSPSSPLTKSSPSTRSHSPILVVSRALRASPVTVDGDDVELEISLPVLGCQTPASAAPRYTPSPIAWSAGGWNPGMFSFDVGSSQLSSHEEEDDQPHVHGLTSSAPEADGLTKLARLSLSPDSSTHSSSDQKQVTSSASNKSRTNQVGTTTSLLTKLTPTAAPFEFKPNPDATAFVPPSASANLSATLNHTALHYSTQPLPFPASASTASATSISIPLHQRQHSDVYDAHASHSSVTRPPGPGRAQTFSAAAYLSTDYVQPSAVHRQQASWQGSLSRSVALSSGAVFPATPPLSVHGSDYLRSRSASVGSTYIGSYFSPHIGGDSVGYPSAQQAKDLQKQAADQLQSYFGPSTVGVNAPLGTYPPSASLYEPAQSVYGPVAGAPVVPDVSPTSPLYVAARDTFVTLAVAGLDPISAASASPSLAAHFDLAMNAPHPLAVLYGVTSDQADQLAASPASSGIDELVLRVAARRTGYRPGPGELGGPSPSNKKINLYKTEPCRSWAEKGSCRYGIKCQFAHSAAELRPVMRHSKFKTEACRTFLTTGVCPYGARCVFRHATEGEEIQSGLTQHMRSQSTSASSGTLTEDPTLAKTRLGLRTSIAAMPPAGFGPALATYLGPSVPTTSTSSTPTISHPASPIQERFTPFESSFPSSITGNGAEGRRFSTSVDVPAGQVPPTYAEAPQSRLQRLSISTQRGMSRSGSVSSGSTAGTGLRTRASFESASALQQFALNAQQRNGNSLSSHPMTRQPNFTNPFAPVPGTPVHNGPVQVGVSGTRQAATTPRHGSTSSFGSFASSSGYASSVLPRQSSNSSLSSFGSKEHSGVLKPAGTEWFAAGANFAGQGIAHGTASLEWDEEKETVEREATPRSSATLYGGPDALLG